MERIRTKKIDIEKERVETEEEKEEAKWREKR